MEHAPLDSGSLHAELNARVTDVVELIYAGVVREICAFLCPTDQHTTTESSYLRVTIRGRVLQMAEKSEQVWMDHFDTATQSSVKTFHRVVHSRRIVAYRKPCSADFALFIHCSSTYLQSFISSVCEAESGFTKDLTSWKPGSMSTTGSSGSASSNGKQPVVYIR